MDENPYKAPEQRGRRWRPRFKLRHVPLLVACLIGAIVLLKLALLFIELAVSLFQEGLPKMPAQR